MDDAAISDLLSRPTIEERLALLDSSGRLHAEGLNELLDTATGLMHRDPLAAREVAALCGEAATRAAEARVRPRAAYLQAQTYAIDGDFAVALEYIDAARIGWEGMGASLEALRTELGRMHVLNELGRHREAVDVGWMLVSALASDDLDPPRLRVRATAHQNLGICFAFTGRYDQALSAYDEAERGFRRLEARRELGHVAHNRGETLRDYGQLTAAVEAFAAAAASFRAGDETLLEARCLTEVGRARFLLGHYVEALEAFHTAGYLLEGLGVRADRHLLLLTTADAYQTLNLHEEALALYRRVEPAFRKAGMAYYLGRTLVGSGMALAGLGVLTDAEKALSEAAEVYEAAGHTPAHAETLLALAGISLRRGERARALDVATTALGRLLAGDWPVSTLRAHLVMAELVLPAVDVAERHVLDARRLAEQLALPPLAHLVAQRLGRIRRLQGRDEEARALLEGAVDTIERLRGTLPQEAMRTAFLADKTDAFADLLGLWLDRGDSASVRRAFEVAERAKARALLDLLAAHARARALDAPDERREHLRRLEDDLSAAYSALLADTESGSRRRGTPALRRQVAALEQHVRLLRLEQPAAPAAGTAGTPLSLEEVRSRLPGDVTILAYHVIEDGEIVAFVSRGRSLRAARRVTTVERVGSLTERLTAQWQRFTVAGDFSDRHADVLLATTRRLLTALYSELFAPVSRLLGAGRRSRGARRLVVIPHGVTHQVPFHALFDGRRHLLERFEISLAPSATVLGLCQTQALQTPGDPRGGALILAPGDRDIPHTQDEARAVAARLPNPDLRLGAGATVDALRNASSRYSVVHLACHGLFRPENPLFSALKLHDGWLTAGQVLSLGLDLAGALVALSACESGRSRVVAGDESLGLARAFLGAGASAVLVSLWLVRDDATAALMGRWYELLSTGERPAAALRTAQLELAARRPHPYFWAPFVMVGAA